MKKYLAIMMCTGLLFTATGCGEKKEDSSKDDTKTEEKTKDETKNEEKTTNKVVTCSSSGSTESAVATFVYDSDGKTISKVSIDYIVPGDSYRQIKNDPSSYCLLFDEENINNCNARLEGDNVIATVDFNIDKLDDADDGFTKNTPIDELIEYMEDDSDDTACTIEEK